MYNIIVIDDHKMLREMISETLNTRGFNVIASSGDAKDSVPLCEKFKPDLILMDIMMPLMDGVTALQEIRKQNIQTPVIALTADAIAGAYDKYLKEGFVDYIAKPFNKDQIRTKINKIFDSEEKNSEKFKDSKIS